MQQVLGPLVFFVAAQLGGIVASLKQYIEANPNELRFVEDTGLPASLTEWTQKWKKLTSEEPTLKNSHGFKIAYGMPSPPGDERARDVIRKTWMKLPGICAGHKESDNCAVHVFFVIGSTKEGAQWSTLKSTAGLMEKIKLKGDVLEVPALDGQDAQHRMVLTQTKLFMWLYYAAERFSWATHVVKSDTDYFPHFQHVLTTLNASRVDSSGKAFQMFGKTIRSHGCNNALADIEKGIGDRHCVYGHAEYFSRALARRLTRDDFREIWVETGEDIAVGVAVTNLVRKKHLHVLGLDPKTSVNTWPEIVGLMGSLDQNHE